MVTSSSPTVFERVRKICCDQLGVEEDKVHMESIFTEDLSADSLDLVELAMSLEEEFGTTGNTLEISDEEAEKLRSVQDVVDFLTEKGIN